MVGRDFGQDVSGLLPYFVTFLSSSIQLCFEKEYCFESQHFGGEE